MPNTRFRDTERVEHTTSARETLGRTSKNDAQRPGASRRPRLPLDMGSCPSKQASLLPLGEAAADADTPMPPSALADAATDAAADAAAAWAGPLCSEILVIYLYLLAPDPSHLSRQDKDK